MTARLFIISLALVALLTIIVEPTLASPHAYQDDNASEARVSEATTHFGLSLMKTMSLKTSASTTATGTDENKQQANTVLSPLSLQILLNMILLGTRDQSLSQAELAEVLGYGIETSGARELSLKASEKEDANSTSARLGRPHQAMHSVVESIMKASRSPVNYYNPPTTDEEIATTEETSDDLYGPSYFLWRQNQADLRAKARTTPPKAHVNFTLANLMLSNKDLVKMNPAYENELKKYYDVKVEQFSRRQDLKNDENPSGGKKLKLHERINNWVKNITQNQITDLADESLASPGLLLVLLNAAHFKGRWSSPFWPESTQNRIFYNEGQSSAGVETKFMRQTAYLGYAEINHKKDQQEEDYAKQFAEREPGSVKQRALLIEPPNQERRRLEVTANISCRALSLPFSLNDGHEMSMVVLLPSQRDGLDRLIENLNAEALNAIYRLLMDQKVDVELPKFNIEASHDVKAMLEELGLTRIFGDSAELDSMFASRIPAKVDKIIHKAKITVDEQGAEAAAASMGLIVETSSWVRPVIEIPHLFIADHPFLYIIRHNRSNMPLFMGQVRSF